MQNCIELPFHEEPLELAAIVRDISHQFLKQENIFEHKEWRLKL